MASRKLTCLLVVFLQVFYTDAQCGDKTASSTPAYVTSPNYPGMYSPNEDCRIKITAPAGKVVYLESPEAHLYKSENCDDNIQIYDGASASATTLQRVCGEDMIMLQSTGQDMFIWFTSNDNREGKGFALKYWSGDAFNPACAGVTDVTGSPVFMKFPSSQPQNCKYTLRALDNYVVSLDLMGWDSPESLRCGQGSFKVTDGGFDVINHCGDDRPFWHVISKGMDLDVTFSTTLTGASKPFYLKVNAINTVVASCADAPNTRIGPTSTFMWYPLFKAGSTFCDNTLQAPETTARVEVVSPPCSDDTVQPLSFSIEEGGVQKTMSCMDDRAVYSSTSKDLTLKPNAASPNPALLKVASFAKNCGANGVPNMLMTPNNATVEEIVLEDIQRDSHCTHKIMAGTPDEQVVLVLSSTLEDDDDCVKVMGATARSTTMIEKYCGKFDPVVFASTGRDLSFTVMTDGKDNGGKIMIKYYSIHTSVQCNRYEELLATRTKQTLMTPNFPNGYPMNAACSWRFVSYRSDYVVVVEVEETDLPDNCNDMGFVNDGELETNDRLGEWCGKRTPEYRGSGQTLLVTFNADHMNTMHKGFKFTYYADNKVPREMVAGTDVLTIAGVFTIIIIAGGLFFIAYRLCTRSRAKRQAKKADRQQLTQ